MNQESRIRKIVFTKQLTILIVFLFLASYSLLHASIVKAQTIPLQSLRITPIISDLQLTPGKTTTFPLTIQNLSRDPVGIHIDISGYDQIGEVPLIQQKPSAIINWTQLSKTDILLAPKSKQTITVTITPPASLGASGYYETLFLSPIVNQDVTPNSPIILSRVGSLVLGTIGKLNYDDLAKKVAITDFTPGNTILNSFPKSLSFTIANHYFTHFDAKPFLTITPLFGKAQTILLPDKHVLPNSARIWQYQPRSYRGQPSIPKDRLFYHMHLAVSVGNGKKVIADTWFVVIPYKTFLVVLALALVLYFAYFKRKRLKKFITILLHG